MDETTRSVRALYEAFPYPSGTPNLRVGFDARYLLSLGERARPVPGPIEVLDAGCGRALGLIGAAALQRDVRFTGVDMNRVALEEARAEAARRGLDNLRFLEGDLGSLSEVPGLDPPTGGYDVVHSSGVVHHMPDPAHGLREIGGVLAPHGICALMVYGNREPIQRVARVVSRLAPPDVPLVRRLELGRTIVEALCEREPDDAAWRAALEADEVEFADRYLHPCERAYDVDALFALVREAGLSFLRWAEPELWRTEVPVALGGPEEASGPAPLHGYRIAESLRRPGKLELYLGRPGNSPRPTPDPSALAAQALAVHPETTYLVERRSLWGSSRLERVSVRRRDEEPVGLPPGPLATAALLFADTVEPFRGADLIELLVQEGHAPAAAEAALGELLRREMIYTPHEVDLVVSVPP